VQHRSNWICLVCLSRWRGAWIHHADDAIRRALTTLRFFWNSPQGPEPNATGYKGFFYHFLDMKTGQRALNCELSTIDSTYGIAGALTAAEYFKRDTEDERENRKLAEREYASTRF